MVDLLQLGIRKKPVNLLNKYFTVIHIVPFLWLLCWGVSIAGMRPMGEVGLPIPVETGSFLIGEKELEPHGGLLMVDENVGTQNVEPVSPFVIPQLLQGFKENTSKFYSSPIEVGNMEELGGVYMRFIDKFSGQPICSQNTEKRANDSKASSNKCYFVGTKIQFWVTLLTGGFAGIAIGLILVICIFCFLYHIKFTNGLLLIFSTT